MKGKLYFLLGFVGLKGFIVLNLFFAVFIFLLACCVMVFSKNNPSPEKKHSSLVSKTRISAIGDSVMLGAKSALAEKFDLHIDAKVSRQSQVAVDLALKLHKKGSLASIVVVHTGNNGPVTKKMLVSLLDTLRDRNRVVLVNNKEPRKWVASNNRLYLEIAPLYSNVRIMDWYSNSVNHPEYFGGDGIHLTGKGAKRYAELVSEVVVYPDARDASEIFNDLVPCQAILNNDTPPNLCLEYRQPIK